MDRWIPASTRLFDSISPKARAQVIKSSARLEEFFESTPPSNGLLALFVCQGNLLEVLREMLDLGLDPSLVADASHMEKDSLCPLAALTYGTPTVLAMVDLLLERGANPNVVIGTHRDDSLGSPMHAAIKDAKALHRLIAAGGSVDNVDENGWTVMDEWLHFAKEFVNTPENILPLLEEIVKGGWDPVRRLQGGRAILPNCWSHRQLRDCLPTMLALGFDASQLDIHRGVEGASLFDLAQATSPDHFTAPVASVIIAHCQSLELAASSPLPSMDGNRRRL